MGGIGAQVRDYPLTPLGVRRLHHLATARYGNLAGARDIPKRGNPFENRQNAARSGPFC